MDKRERNSSIELLRLLLMLMVLILHVNKDVLFTEAVDGMTFNLLYLRILESCCIISVNCFILISGYFSAIKKRLNVYRIMSLIILTCFYGSSIYLFCCLIGNEHFTTKELIRSAIPFFFDRHWFINIYLVLAILSPFINKGIMLLSKKSFQLLLLIMLLCFSVWPTFLPNPPNTDRGYGIVSFILIYCIGAYLRIYGNSFCKSRAIFLSAYLMSTAIIFVFYSLSGWTWKWLDYNSLFNVFSSVMFFLFFLRTRFTSVWINNISKSAIAVYLIHTNHAIRPNIFTKWFAVQNFLFEPTFVIRHVLIIVSIFTCCIFLDIGRRCVCGSLEKVALRSSWFSSFYRYSIEI